MSRNMPLLVRFISKLFLDILPAALASVIGGFLFTHYDWSQLRAPAVATERAAPTSPEMMQMVRDEHAAVVSYLKAQVAAEKDRLAAEDAAADAASNAPETVATAAPVAAAPGAVVPGAAAPGVAAIAAVEARPLALPAQEPPRLPAAAVTPAPQTPLVIAQAEPDEAALRATDPNPLLAATINVKDHVVATTQHAFAAIGGIPSWIIALGGRISGQGANASPAGRFVGASG
jgi:hypothetical protein